MHCVFFLVKQIRFIINKKTVDESQEIPLMNAYFDRETEHIQQVGSLFSNPDYMQIIVSYLYGIHQLSMAFI